MRSVPRTRASSARICSRNSGGRCAPVLARSIRCTGSGCSPTRMSSSLRVSHSIPTPTNDIWLQGNGPNDDSARTRGNCQTPWWPLCSIPAMRFSNGFYIRPFAEREVRVPGLDLPPLMWIFEWDMVGGWHSLLSLVYRVTRGRDSYGHRRRPRLSRHRAASSAAAGNRVRRGDAESTVRRATAALRSRRVSGERVRRPGRVAPELSELLPVAGYRQR